MHKEHAKDGLAIISVSLDSLDPEDTKEKKEATKKQVLDFLRDKNAAFTNLLLDEPQEFYQEKLRFQALPALYVFSRQGKWTQFKSDNAAIKYGEIDRLVLELLREK